MNKRDRKNIASLLASVATDDRIIIVQAGLRLLADHPNIKDDLADSEHRWWGFAARPPNQPETEG